MTFPTPSIQFFEGIYEELSNVSLRRNRNSGVWRSHFLLYIFCYFYGLREKVYFVIQSDRANKFPTYVFYHDHNFKIIQKLVIPPAAHPPNLGHH